MLSASPALLKRAILENINIPLPLILQKVGVDSSAEYGISSFSAFIGSNLIRHTG